MKEIKGILASRKTFANCQYFIASFSELLKRDVFQETQGRGANVTEAHLLSLWFSLNYIAPCCTKENLCSKKSNKCSYLNNKLVILQCLSK